MTKHLRHLAWSFFALTLVLGSGRIVSPRVEAQTLQVLYSFTGGADGGFPAAGVVRDSAGNLYGTTTSGGESCFGNDQTCGVLFKLDPSGEEMVLHTFTGDADGGDPDTDLLLDAAGNLYGGTAIGGPTFNGGVFRLTRSGKFASYLFNGPDGGGPDAPFIEDSAGNLYGTTSQGGIYNEGESSGVVFRLDQAGKETVIHAFMGGIIGDEDGATPQSNLVYRDGDLYGTTVFGGSVGAGAVYKIDATGKETVVATFSYTGEVNYPFGRLARDAAGNIYSISEGSGNGTVFKLDATNQVSLLYSFAGGTDGQYPSGGLIQDAAGNLYGTTSGGGDLTCGCGTVYKVSATGEETVLYRFTGPDGRSPQADLYLDSAGNLYGTTRMGGAFNSGVVFKLTP